MIEVASSAITFGRRHTICGVTNDSAQLSVIAIMADMSLDQVYRRFRRQGAPAPVDHPACVPVYNIAAALEYLGRAVTRIGDAGVIEVAPALAEPRPGSDPAAALPDACSHV